MIHERAELGAKGCGKPAFYLTKRLKQGDPVTAEAVFWLDGTPAQPLEPIQCGSCGGGVALMAESIKVNKAEP